MFKFMYTTVAALTFISGCVAYTIITIYRVKRKYRAIPGPDSKGIFGFFVGDAAKFLNTEKKEKILSDVIYDDMQMFNSKTIKYRIFHKILLVTSDPQLIKEALIEKNFQKDPGVYDLLASPGGERYMGRGLVTIINKDKWKHNRALYDPGFHKQSLKNFMKIFNSKGDILVNNLKRVSINQKESIVLLDKFNQTALDMIASIAFSIDSDSINDSNNKLNKYIDESLKGIRSLYLFNPFPYLNPFKWSQIKAHKNSIREIRKMGKSQIESRLNALKNGDKLPNDLLSTVLKSHEDEQFYIEDMVDEFVTFFIGGQETTASALSSTFLELGRSSDVLEKLQNEIDKELGIKEEIDYEDLAKLKYTGCVFKEVLRLHPPADQIFRKTESEIVYNDITIPKDTPMMINIYAAGRSEEHFTEPLKFKPDRFMTDTLNNYTFLPFSLGARNCIGQNFAQIEAKVLIAKIIQNFNFTLDPNQSFEFEQATTTRTKDGTKCFLTLRN